ncbi:SulP family inorganic anion transporter [Rhodoferax sp. PAMC 29310]|uniref:SulP family inorganic anion transporter n=1 Tax=Rhodoferax sp. PAMC 29310 TaxID=2822760 RepID=UPI001B32FF04|nr:SulP family inorganic anion transporter [Rhodoferax sp. PAMC 29310]
MSLLFRLFPFLTWPRPTPALLRADMLAGLSVGLMVIPQGVAYAALAGMPLVTGIYAAMLPALIAVLFSASRRLSVGPTALTCLLVGTSLTGLAEPGSAQWVELAVWLALLTGAMQVCLGLMRFGWLLNLVSAPVLMAFTQGAALLIIGSQLPALLGMKGPWFQMWSPSNWHLPSAAFGLSCLILLTLAKRWRPTFPAVLLIVLASAGISHWTGFAASGGAVVGPLPQGLPALYIPELPGWRTLSNLLLPTLVIALVSFLETAASAKVDNEKAGRRWNQDQDLIGQGMGKITAGLCGAFPTSSSFSRSALTLYAGARSGWATVASVGVVLIVLLAFTSILSHVPQSILAAIVLTAISGLIKPQAFTQLWRVSRIETSTAAVTLGITVAAAPALHWGVLTGMLMGLSYFLYQRLHPRIIEVGLHPDGSLRDRHLWHLDPIAPDVYALRMDAELDFASASSLLQAISEHLAAHPGLQHVCLFAQPINRIDATGVQAFSQLRETLVAQGVTLHLSGLKLPVEVLLRKAGELENPDQPVMYRTDAEALKSFHDLDT